MTSARQEERNYSVRAITAGTHQTKLQSPDPIFDTILDANRSDHDSATGFTSDLLHCDSIALRTFTASTLLFPDPGTNRLE